MQPLMRALRGRCCCEAAVAAAPAVAGAEAAERLAAQECAHGVREREGEAKEASHCAEKAGASSGAFSANVFTPRITKLKYSIMSQSVQCFGKKKNAVRHNVSRTADVARVACIDVTCVTRAQVAVSHCKKGKGIIKVNGRPLSLVEVSVVDCMARICFIDCPLRA